QLTVSAWIYRNASQASWRLVVSRQRGASYDDQYILGFLDNAYQFGVNTSGTSGLASGGTAPNGQWIHLAGTYDGTAARLFVNGALVASVPASGAILIDASRPLLIGAGQNDSTSAVHEAFSGRVEDVRVYRKAPA